MNVKLDIMNRQRIVAKRLLDLFKILSSYPNCNFMSSIGTVNILLEDGRQLLSISDRSIEISNMKIPETLFSLPSRLEDWSVPVNQLQKFVQNVFSLSSTIKLNHIGFYYLVESLEDEKIRLKTESKNASWHIYEENSHSTNDKWFYVGDKTNWEDPLIELVPTLRRDDEWKDYQLPHIQIDFNTKIDGFIIENLATRIFKGKVIPYHLIMIDDKPVLTRVWLGVVSGVNIFLDFGTDKRQPKWHRVRMLKEVFE